MKELLGNKFLKKIKIRINESNNYKKCLNNVNRKKLIKKGILNKNCALALNRWNFKIKNYRKAMINYQN